MLVAVTGGAGFVGQHLIDRLTRDGFKVRALQHRQTLPPYPDIEIVTGSLDSSASLAMLVRGADAIVHAGGLVAARHTHDFDRVNAQGTRQLAAAARDHSVPRFLLVSSLAARQPALSPYAASKRTAEEILSSSRLTGWDILRPPAVYGPGDKQILPLFRLLRSGLALLPAGRDARASILHVADLAGAIAIWLRSGKAAQTCHEIDDGASDGHLWRDILQAAGLEFGVKPHFVVPPRWLLDFAGRAVQATAGLRRNPSFLTPGKIRELCWPDWVARESGAFGVQTGWHPAIPLAEGLRSTIAAYCAQGLV